MIRSEQLKRAARFADRPQQIQEKNNNFFLFLHNSYSARTHTRDFLFSISENLAKIFK